MIAVSSHTTYRFTDTGPPDYSPGGLPSRPLPKAVTDLPVLVIEDEAMIAWMVEDILESLGFTTIAVAACSKAALELADREAPGLIVSDINLGAASLDGVSTVAQIARGQPLPVLFITGHAGADTLARIEAEVALSRTLRKPEAYNELSEAIFALTVSARPN